MIFNGNISDMKWGVPEEERENIFVFIGKNLDHDWLKSCFKACLVTNQLRFKIGDKVQANVGEFQNGTVVKTWVSAWMLVLFACGPSLLLILSLNCYLG